MSNTLFRKASLDRISSPEQLNDYIKVSNPSIWAVIIALCVLLVTVFIWSMIGRLPTNVDVVGVMHNGKAMCYLNMKDVASVKVGQPVKLQGLNNDEVISGTIGKVEVTPESETEIAAELKSDYLVESMGINRFAVKVLVTVTVSNSKIVDGTLLKVKIITQEKRPIDFLMN